MNNLAIEDRILDKSWLDEVVKKLSRKMPYAIRKARENDFIPYSTENGQWKRTAINWWTNGFWPAGMWQMYFLTGDRRYPEEAARSEKLLDKALADFQTLSHDVGFMWLIHSGVRWAHEKNQDSFARAMFAANTLAGRYNPNGFIRAWNGEGKEGWAIVDCMMNLPLLYWASETTGDPRYRLIAMRHADTTMNEFVRADGSCCHIVIFDPETGEKLDAPAGQGYAPGSSWSRGQAWALYGFALSYLYTGKRAYLDTAKRVANYFIASIADDYLPRCDFRQPKTPDIRDDAAGMCAASGLLELSRILPETEGAAYYHAAIQLLMCAEREHINWTKDTPALLTHCTSAWHDEAGRHITMFYADYFFIEAINKLRGETRLAWRPAEMPAESGGSL